MDNAAMIAGLGCELFVQRIASGNPQLTPQDLLLEAVPTGL
jgi:tRNA A37 threonylcarbamoyltransferase TsaD